MKIFDLAPFINSFEYIIREVADVSFVIEKPYEKSSPYILNDTSVLFGILGGIKGQVLFSMNKELAQVITSAMLKKMGLSDSEEFKSSAISEFGNMIMGNAANEYYKKGITFDITPPSILTGNSLSFSVDKMAIDCIPVRFENNLLMEINIVYKII